VALNCSHLSPPTRMGKNPTKPWKLWQGQLRPNSPNRQLQQWPPKKSTLCPLKMGKATCWWTRRASKHSNEPKPKSVATLALGSQPRQGLAKARANREARECERVWEWTLTLPSELPFWDLESWWTFESSKNDCRGQTPLHWKVLYIIKNLLKRKCLKWVRMTHLDIWNTSYGQKKG
jgi:hypothetical protein